MKRCCWKLSASLRLWGGRKRLLRRLLQECEPLAGAQWAQGATSLTALGLLRLKLRGETAPARLPQDLPLEVLSAALEHVATLERIGCRSWGDLRDLPRAGVARRFGAGLLDALDAAYGERPERYRWLQLPEEFDLKFELASLATTAPELMWSAQRLLTHLQVWLQARHRGVLALELEWTLDLRRLNGVRLPSHERLVVRTAQPTQDIAHLRRLVGEHLSRSTLSAPANHLRLRSLETAALGRRQQEPPARRQRQGRAPASTGGAAQRAPRREQCAGAGGAGRSPARAHAALGACEAGRTQPARRRRGKSKTRLYPPWLLPQPLRLEVKGEKPHYYGPLRLLAGPQRLETGWWDDSAQGPASRDYFIARSDEAGLLWVYRERLAARSGGDAETAPVRWFLQGIYA